MDGPTRGRLADSRITDSRVDFFSGVDIHHNRLIRSDARAYAELWAVDGLSIADNLFVDGAIFIWGRIPTQRSPDISGEIVRNDIRGGHVRVQGGASLGPLVIADNTLVGGHGIYVSGVVRNPPPLDGAGPVTIRGNRTLRNHGYGIYLIGTVAFIDGGANVARHNTLDPQCVGLVCTRT